jgi:hypothetical protein
VCNQEYQIHNAPPIVQVRRANRSSEIGGKKNQLESLVRKGKNKVSFVIAMSCHFTMAPIKERKKF